MIGLIYFLGEDDIHSVKYSWSLNKKGFPSLYRGDGKNSNSFLYELDMKRVERLNPNFCILAENYKNDFI